MKLSIIITTYNCSSFIGSCLASLSRAINQDTTEVIIIEDCSTDNTIEIIERYISENIIKNIVFKKNNINKGCGVSRNKGLALATGEYVGFLDSDDFIDDNYYINMLKLAEKENADVVVSDIVNYTPTNILMDDSVKKVKTLTTEESLNSTAPASACTKIFKKSIIKPFKFRECCCDDLTFTIPTLSLANKIVYCPNNNYYYRENPNSITRTLNFVKTKESLDSIFETINILYQLNKTEVIKQFIVISFLPFFYSNIIHKNNNEKKQIIAYLNNISKQYKYNLEEYLYNNKYIKIHDKEKYPKFYPICLAILVNKFEGLMQCNY